MKRHHLFAYYCTLLVPIGVLAGAGTGMALGVPVSATVIGVLLGLLGSLRLLGSGSSPESLKTAKVRASSS